MLKRIVLIGGLGPLVLAGAAGAAPLRLSEPFARRAILAALVPEHATSARVTRCHRLSAPSVSCGVLEEWVTQPTAATIGVIEVFEGAFTVTLKHDHRKTYVRVHYDG